MATEPNKVYPASNDAIQARFDLATEQHIPHYYWFLPEWKDQNPFKLDDNVTEAPIFKEPTPLNCVVGLKKRIVELKQKYEKAPPPYDIKHVTADRELENDPNSENEHPLKKMPHPRSNFEHSDSDAFEENHKQKIRAAVKAVEDVEELVRADDEIAASFSQALGPLRRANGLLDPNAKGMQRLRLVFEWTLCQVTTLFGEINAALANSNAQQGKVDYNRAREKYMDLLHDLDERHPETRGPNRRPIPGERGYGCAIKWAYILPLIHGGKIKGAKVVAKWNPHISSSGIPVPHS